MNPQKQGQKWKTRKASYKDADCVNVPGYENNAVKTSMKSTGDITAKLVTGNDVVPNALIEHDNSPPELFEVGAHLGLVELNEETADAETHIPDAEVAEGTKQFIGGLKDLVVRSSISPRQGGNWRRL